MSATSSAPRPITGRFVLIAVVSFFAVVIGVNVVMMRPGLILDDLEDLEFNVNWGQ